MARWRLTSAHYLNIPGTMYHYEETDRESGEVNRMSYPVPRALDPKNPRDCRSAEGCVVAYEGSNIGRDWVMKGDPTPDMEPLDAEARKISASFESRWAHPIDTLPTHGDFSSALFDKLSRQLDAVFTKGGAIQSQSVAGVDPERFAKMEEQLAALMARNAELEAAKPTGSRRV